MVDENISVPLILIWNEFIWCSILRYISFYLHCYKREWHDFLAIIFSWRFTFEYNEYIKKITAITIVKLRVTHSQTEADKKWLKNELFYQGGWKYYVYVTCTRAYRRHHMCNTVYWICEWCMASDCMVRYLHLRLLESEKSSFKLSQKESESERDGTKKDTMSMVHDGAYE